MCPFLLDLHVARLRPQPWKSDLCPDTGALAADYAGCIAIPGLDQAHSDAIVRIASRLMLICHRTSTPEPLHSGCGYVANCLTTPFLGTCASVSAASLLSRLGVLIHGLEPGCRYVSQHRSGRHKPKR